MSDALDKFKTALRAFDAEVAAVREAGVEWDVEAKALLRGTWTDIRELIAEAEKQEERGSHFL
jgi:hypothetical protein